MEGRLASADACAESSLAQVVRTRKVGMFEYKEEDGSRGSDSPKHWRLEYNGGSDMAALPARIR